MAVDPTNGDPANGTGTANGGSAARSDRAAHDGGARTQRGLDADIARMANHIAAQFRHLPEPAATDAVATHLRMFWDPGMRAALRHHLATAGTDLDPLVHTAATHLG